MGGGARVMRSETQIIPFGKYKGRPVESLAADREYCEWLISQEWFRTKFIGIHTLIVNHFGEPTETPEHNLLQACFLDAEWCQRFCMSLGFADSFALFLKRSRAYSGTWRFAVFDREFETEGIDVKLSGCMMNDAEFVWERIYKIECKPRISDDYPAVLRQMRATKANVLVVGSLESAVVPEDAIRRIFMHSGVAVRTVAEIEVATAIWPPYGE